MTTYILVRHGETDWNKNGRFQGQTNIPLNDTGLAQAIAASEHLAERTISAIYTSDLTRTQQTAIVINDHHNLPLTTTRSLREIFFGKWEGLSWLGIGEQYPTGLAEWKENYWEFEPPSGESIRQATARIAEGFHAINANHGADETVLISGHGGTFQLLLCHLLGIKPTFFWQFRMDNCAISEITVHDEGMFIGLWNGRYHLTNLESTDTMEQLQSDK